MLYYLIIFWFGSFNFDTCSHKVGFSLDYELFREIKVDNNSYCQLVNKSLRQNPHAILLLSQMPFNDGIKTYQHGAVLIEIIDRIGETRYLEIIKSLPKQQQNLIYWQIASGLEYTNNPKYFGDYTQIASLFPQLSAQLQ